MTTTPNAPDCDHAALARELAGSTVLSYARAEDLVAAVATMGAQPLLAENLSAKHIGAKVTIIAPGVAYTGRIEDISFNVDRMYGPNEATSVRVEFDRATIAFPLGATVEVHS